MRLPAAAAVLQQCAHVELQVAGVWHLLLYELSHLRLLSPIVSQCPYLLLASALTAMCSACQLAPSGAATLQPHASSCLTAAPCW
jgi:hypothetical protein